MRQGWGGRKYLEVSGKQDGAGGGGTEHGVEDQGAQHHQEHGQAAQSAHLSHQMHAVM